MILEGWSSFIWYDTSLVSGIEQTGLKLILVEYKLYDIIYYIVHILWAKHDPSTSSLKLLTLVYAFGNDREFHPWKEIEPEIVTTF